MHPLSIKMELIKIITFLILFFSSLQPTVSSLQTQSHTTIQHQGILNARQKIYLPVLHRKLIFTKKVKESDKARDLESHKKKDSLPAGKENKKKQKMEVGKKGTRQEWMESEEDPSQYFTMDYNRVKRRRPIHNK
ncbi:protein GOLVEN 6-like [Vicia villosa]|uniref:protein GOLVEN 6-like n=1 Tax=Vicia villosa TaxID=3911 RepID=UPI00273C2D62|nr:protein GOLVEN 6-like [Vicia villosa]